MTVVPPSTAQARKRRRRNQRIVIAVILVVIGLIVWGKYFNKTEELLSVDTAKVARRDLTESVLANGRVQPVTQVTINPEVAGEIIELPVK
ncbi:MAG: hypothetical protein ACAI37_11090 [Chthoniobacter sp.]